MQQENKKIAKNTSLEIFCQNISTKSKGFTLVELIIVITILAILGTIAYISFQGYTKDARDGVRISDIKQIYNGLSIYKTQTEKTLLPDNYISIQSGTTTISYQGYAGASVLRTLKISGGKDPGTKDYYIYTTDVNTKKAQLMTYMETSDKDIQYLSKLFTNQVNALTNTGYYQDKKIYVYGDKIGILTNNKVPLQETTTNTGIDITSLTGNITTYFGGNVYSGGLSTSTGLTLINEINGALNNLTSNKYIVSGTITNGSGGIINVCGTSTNIESSGNFTLSNINYGTNCSGISVSRNGYNCSISTDGPISLISYINNIAGSCSLQYLDVANSLRFDSSRSTYLTRTPSVGNRQKWTWSGWIKRAGLSNGGTNGIFVVNSPASNSTGIQFYKDKIDVFFAGGYSYRLTSTNTYTNTKDWLHLVVSADTTPTGGTNNVKIYVNNSILSVFDTASYPPSGYLTDVNNSVINAIGKDAGGNNLNGYMSEINFIDGHALGPSDFGVNIGGKWLPKAYTGTYGTNGFHLNFNNSGNLGDDVAGSNDWSISPGIQSYDQMIDTPTNNFNIWDINNKYSSNCSLTNGGLRFGNGSFGSTGRSFSTNLINSGKWYFEISANFGTPSGSYAPFFGFVRQGYLNTSTHIGDDANSWGFSINGGGGTGYKRNNSSSISLPFTISSNSWFGIRLDADTGTFDVTPDGTNWYNIYSGMTGPFYFAYGDRGGIPDHQANFGQGGQSGLNWCANAGGYFKNCPPIGYKALSSKNTGN